MAQENYVRGVCKKCAAVVHVPVGEHAIPDLQELLGVLQGFECPGQHVEFGTALEQYEWDWDPVEREAPPTDEHFGRMLIAQHGCANVLHMGKDTLGEALGIRRLQSIAGLEHMGFGDFADATHYYVRRDSPLGTRFYVRSERKRAS
jgi:hypothetical protein